MPTIASARCLAVVLLLLAATVAVAACSEDAPTPELISASLLIEADPASPQWYEDLSLNKGVDGYELLEAATGGDIESEWYPEYRSHFVQTILGVAPEGSQYWSVFVWNETAADGAGAWEPLPVGADLFSVKDGHVLGWALVEYDPDNPALPQATPR